MSPKVVTGVERLAKLVNWQHTRQHKSCSNQLCSQTPEDVMKTGESFMILGWYYGEGRGW